MTHLFQVSWREAKNLIEQEPQTASDLFYDWFCSNKSLLNRAKRLIPKVDYIFKSLDLDETKYTVTFKNNCPVYGELYDSFIIDSLDDKRRLYISPRLGYSAEDLNHKCSVSVITYDEKVLGVYKFDRTFDGWQKFKNHINNSNLKDEILEALNG